MSKIDQNQIFRSIIEHLDSDMSKMFAMFLESKPYNYFFSKVLFEVKDFLNPGHIGLGVAIDISFSWKRRESKGIYFTIRRSFENTLFCGEVDITCSMDIDIDYVQSFVQDRWEKFFAVLIDASLGAEMFERFMTETLGSIGFVSIKCDENDCHGIINGDIGEA